MKSLLTCFLLLTLGCFGQNDAPSACIYPKNSLPPVYELFLETKGQINFVKRVEATWFTGSKLGKCAIEFHGNSTRLAGKKSYDLEFRTENGSDQAQQILGLPNSESIVLLANVFDPTMMRNALAFDSWSQLGHVAPGYSYCQVYVNGTYQGLYLATEKIRKINRLIDPSTCTTNPTLLKKPFLLKIDWENEGTVQIQGVTDWPFKGKVLDPKPFTNKWMGYDAELETYFKHVNRSLNFIIDSAQDSVPYSNYIDVTSFVDYFLVSELSKNPDAYHSSLFLYSGAAGKLTVGPIWDFDLAFANTMNPEDDSIQGWIYKKDLPYNQLKTTPTWWYLLLCDSSFRQLCLERITVLEKWIQSDDFTFNLRERIEQLRESMTLDDIRWSKWSDSTGLGPVSISIEPEVTAIHRFLMARLEWMKIMLPTETCLAPFEVSERQEKYELLLEDSLKKQFTIKFNSDLSAASIYAGTRYEYRSSFSYTLKNSYGVLIQTGPVSGKELIISSVNLPKGEYYLVVSERPENDLVATSAPRMTIEYRKKLVVLRE